MIYLTTLTEVIKNIGRIFEGCFWISKGIIPWLKKPNIEYRLHDSFSISNIDPHSIFYIIATSRFPFPKLENQKISIKLILKPKVGKTTDFKVKVTPWFTKIGWEALQEIKISEEDLDDHKEVIFDLQPYQKYRIIIITSIGHTGDFAHDTFELTIDSNNANIINKPN